MAEALSAAAAAFAVVLLAEMGDKSQLVLLAQAARHRPGRVLAEALAAQALVLAAAVTLGAALGRFVPAWAAAAGSGILFLGFGVAALREARGTADGHEGARAGRRGGTFALVLVSELGDKTMLAAAALAASSGHALATGLGALAAEAVAAVFGVAAGAWLGRRLAERRRAWLAAATFLGAGAASLGWAVWLLAR